MRTTERESTSRIVYRHIRETGLYEMGEILTHSLQSVDTNYNNTAKSCTIVVGAYIFTSNQLDCLLFTR